MSSQLSAIAGNSMMRTSSPLSRARPEIFAIDAKEASLAIAMITRVSAFTAPTEFSYALARS